MLTLDEVKAQIKAKVDVTGQAFSTPKGVVGTVLAERSPSGKLQADLTCATQGCTVTHRRVQSDWHQSAMCQEHARNRKARAPSSGTSTQSAEADAADTARRIDEKVASIAKVQERVREIAAKFGVKIAEAAAPTATAAHSEESVTDEDV